MDTVLLNDGNHIPKESFGTYRIPPGAQTYEVVAAALKVGYRSLDTASLYRNEADVGRAIRDSDIPRSSIFITTKVWDVDQGFERAQVALQESLAALDMDYIDLYLIHSPRPGKDLRLVTWRALVALKDRGLARSIGVSNFGIRHLEEISSAGLPLPSVNQIDRHPLLPRHLLARYCAEKGIVLQAHSPLMRGRKWDHPILQLCAAKYGASVAQVLLAWAAHTGDCFVVGDRSGRNIEGNFDATNRPQLTEEDIRALVILSKEEYHVMGKDLTLVD